MVMKQSNRQVAQHNLGSKPRLEPSLLLVLFALLACKGLPGKSDNGASTTSAAPAPGAPLVLN